MSSNKLVNKSINYKTSPENKRENCSFGNHSNIDQERQMNSSSGEGGAGLAN
jgi:hypothetical protein